MAAECGDRGDGAICGLTRMPRKPPQPLRFVHHEEIDAGGNSLPCQRRLLDEGFERDNRAAMDVERIEAGAEIVGDVRQARRVEQGEDLVILAPQLAEPLDGERFGRDDQAALDLLGVQQVVHDERGFDRLPQADLVGEQPSHRHPHRCALGDVELVREQANAPAEERAEALGLARLEQVQDVQTRQEVFGLVGVAGRQPLDKRPFTPRRTFDLGHERIAVRREAQRRVRARKMDNEDAAFDGRHASRAELGIEAVGQVVPDGPGMHVFDCTEATSGRSASRFPLPASERRPPREDRCPRASSCPISPRCLHHHRDPSAARRDGQALHAQMPVGLIDVVCH